jgi:hypothetical protein
MTDAFEEYAGSGVDYNLGLMHKTKFRSLMSVLFTRTPIPTPIPSLTPTLPPTLPTTLPTTLPPTLPTTLAPTLAPQP